MTFKELKKGDKLYVVNEGLDFGIRLEEHVIEEITEAYGGEYLAFKLDDTCTAYIYYTLFEGDKCGVYFTNKKDAQKYFLKKEHEIYCTLVGKASKYLRNYNNCVEIMNNISNERDRIEEEMILDGSNLEN